jgi:hypothetical protein
MFPPFPLALFGLLGFGCRFMGKNRVNDFV